MTPSQPKRETAAIRPIEGAPPQRKSILSADERITSSLILLVEDDPLSRRLTTEALSSHGFHNVHAVGSGQEALDFIGSHAPDLIILDLLMPDMDGFSFCKAFRAQPELKDVPILVCTALENELKRLSIFDIGASDLAIKPITQEELVSRCRIHLEKWHIMKDLQDYRAGMEADLSHAREMQNLLMPDQEKIARIEREYGLDIGAVFAPSIAISGDFWGIRPLQNPGQVALYLGDFTGHGVTAAINVFRLCALLGKLPEETLAQPSLCLSQLNAQLYGMLPRELFSTLFYAVLDTRSHTLHYSVAGNPPPLKIEGNGLQRFSLLEGAGLPLAAIASPQYRDYTTSFHRGDALLLYSDALIETPGPKNTYPSITDFAATLAAIPPARRRASDMLDTVLAQLEQFTQGRPVEDDLTLNLYRRL